MNEREIVIKNVCNAINDVINCIISENEQMNKHGKEKEVYTVLEVFCNGHVVQSDTNVFENLDKAEKYLQFAVDNSRSYYYETYGSNAIMEHNVGNTWFKFSDDKKCVEWIYYSLNKKTVV